ncbi:hemolysin family protein [Blattabacterium cuenoti]|uniref:hemolysin family protein n=1 Tax=Blattabacterium cuenoti TaxID=1653831 RepID=UPI00163B68FB|nr:hemolysin family protein [Blattabacterium cuenoti]
MIFYISIVSISILISSFFSGIEMAIISCNLFQVELEKKKNSIRYKILYECINNYQKLMTTMLIGNTISLVIYGIYMNKIFFLLFSYFDNSIWLFILETIISTIIILIIGEFIPKMIFSIYSNELLTLFIIPVYIIYKIFTPITNLIICISNFFLKILGGEKDFKKKIFDKNDLINFISKSVRCNLKKTGSVSEYKIDIFHKALNFYEKKARECIVPRKEIISSNIIESSVDHIRNLFTKSGLSKIVIYKDNIDNIIGYVHYLEFFKKPKNLDKSIIRPIELFYINTSVREIMDILIRKKISIAIILDEYGGTAGLITIEDILEEFLGDIKDEHDEIFLLDKKINNNKFLFSARLEVDFINSKYNLDIPKSDEYKTLGGLIVTHTGNIPNNGDKISINQDFYIEIIKVSKNKIEEVIFYKKKKSDEFFK